MLNREACERRVYRLATLLTGNPRLAVGVITTVVDAQPDLSRLDSAHLDRLTVLRSREVRPGLLDDELIPKTAAKALSMLSQQQREAWVFARVYRLPMRELSKSMDCSLTATQRHLQVAERAMLDELGEHSSSAAEALLRYSMSLEVPAFYRARRRRRIMIRRIAMGLMLLVIAAAVIAGITLWRNAS